MTAAASCGFASTMESNRITPNVRRWAREGLE
jgi:hypothetical protein